MKRICELLLLIACGLLPLSSHALNDVLFGPEFTFMDTQNPHFESVMPVVHRMCNHLIDGQPDGARFTREQSREVARGTFLSPNGWSFSHEPEGDVLEVQMSKGTVEHFRHFAADMQDAIFVSCANEGFFPALFLGGGHINVSSAQMFANRLLFRNFIVDLLNHSELFMGAFGYDTNNALPLQMLPEESIAEVRRVLDNFDNGAYSDESDPFRIDFTSDLHLALNTVRYEPFYLSWFPEITVGRGKYHAVHVNKINRDPISRIEIRGVRPQASMDVWVRQIALINDRIKFLESIHTPIPLKWSVRIEALDVERHKLNPPVDPQVAMRAFYGFVREAGQRWSDHRDYLWPKWITDGHLERFEKSYWFLRQEKKFGGRGNLVEECEGELGVAL